MYSGSTMTVFSGRLIGAHQKIDRLARTNLERLAPDSRFPNTRSILHFEGRHGPDAIKRKSPAKDEPWHFLQPFDPDDTHLIGLIERHYKQLVDALKEKDEVRASFEAAWLAHAVVDGLTPAHHYPYEEKLMELSSGSGNAARTTIGKKLIVPGRSPGHQVRNNWKMWGPKGLFTTHAAFEMGVAYLIVPLKSTSRRLRLTSDKIEQFEAQSLPEWFRNTAQEVARLELYDAFYKSGWTIGLARRVRNQLTPILVQAVELVWYGALVEAGLAGHSR
ncbi:MAG TPA: hypothetical protein VHA05_03635 [Candidatus Saccharimonadales bacterium]|nr:hypothetical protein [Candidatus Saccharimonadales bacterium]